MRNVRDQRAAPCSSARLRGPVDRWSPDPEDCRRQKLKGATGQFICGPPGVGSPFQNAAALSISSMMLDLNSSICGMTDQPSDNSADPNSHAKTPPASSCRL